MWVMISSERGGISLSRLGWGRTSETLAQHNRHLGVAAARAVKANFTACPREAGVVLVLNVVQPQARSDRSSLPWSRNSRNRRYVSAMPLCRLVRRIG